MNNKFKILIVLSWIFCLKSADCGIIFNNIDGMLESIQFTEDVVFDVLRGGPEELAVTLVIKDVFESPTFYSTDFPLQNIHLLGNTEAHINSQRFSTATWFSIVYDDDGDGIINLNVPIDIDTHDLYINFGFDDMSDPGKPEAFFEFAFGDTFTIRQGEIIHVPGSPYIPFPDLITDEVEVQLISALYSIEYSDRYRVAVVPEPTAFALILSSIVLVVLLKNKRLSRSR